MLHPLICNPALLHTTLVVSTAAWIAFIGFLFYANVILFTEEAFLWLVNLYDKDFYLDHVAQCTRDAPDWLSTKISTPSIYALNSALKEHLRPATVETWNVFVFAIDEIMDFIYATFSLNTALHILALIFYV